MKFGRNPLKSPVPCILGGKPKTARLPNVLSINIFWGIDTMKTKLALSAFVAAFVLSACAKTEAPPAPAADSTPPPAAAPDAAASAAADSAAAASAAADAANSAASAAGSPPKQ
jgi:hypothetical protein